jgi:hypothetical protein
LIPNCSCPGFVEDIEGTCSTLPNPNHAQVWPLVASGPLLLHLLSHFLLDLLGQFPSRNDNSFILNCSKVEREMAEVAALCVLE